MTHSNAGTITNKKHSGLKWRVKWLLLLGAGLLACNSHGADKLKTYYEHPDLNLGAYNKVLLDPLALSNAKVVPPPWVEGEERSPRKWALSDDDIAFAKQAYRSAMKQQLAEGGAYPIVEQPAEDVLEISISIINLTPFAQRDEKVQTRGTGELRMQVQLRDAMSRELLAIYEGEQTVGKEYQENTPLSAENDMTQLFAEWGVKVRRALDRDHGGKRPSE